MSALERDRPVVVQPESAVGMGKPPNRFLLTEHIGALTAKAYAPMLDVILCAARNRVGSRRYAQILEDAATRSPAIGPLQPRWRHA